MDPPGKGAEVSPRDNCGRFITGPPTISRFLAKVEVNEAGCWIWTGARQGNNGYGNFRVNGCNVGAHRWAYEFYRGEIARDVELDHTCRVRPCANPWHLEVVTHAENIRRGDLAQRRRTHCPQGHPYDALNTRIYRGMRYCRTCIRLGKEPK
jgi:hypothetical protein